MKKVGAFFVVFCVVLSLFSSVYANSNEFDVNANAWLVMDKTSSRIISGGNMTKAVPIASTTKIMTAIIAMEELNLDDIVTVSESAAKTEGSSMYLLSQQQISVENLLYGLILRSGNDSAVALCEYHDLKSKISFVAKMNAKAKALGCSSTSFKNPHGLDEEGHFSTAHDLALMTAYALEKELFCLIASSSKHSYYDNIRKKEVTLYSGNKLLTQYPNALGVKTGYTEQAGKCLVGYVKKDSKELITVLLGCSDTVGETKRLCEHVFSHYDLYNVIPKGTKITSISVQNAPKKQYDIIMNRDFFMLLNEDEAPVVKYRASPMNELNAPVPQNTKIANIEILANGKVIFSKELKSMCIINEKRNVFEWFFSLFSPKGA